MARFPRGRSIIDSSAFYQAMIQPSSRISFEIAPNDELFLANNIVCMQEVKAVVAGDGREGEGWWFGFSEICHSSTVDPVFKFRRISNCARQPLRPKLTVERRKFG